MASHALGYDPVPTINPTGAPGGRQSLDVSADMFGGAVARAETQLGQGIGEIGKQGMSLATQQSEIDARTHAAEVHSWQSDQVTNAQEGFLGLRGKAAIEALPVFKEKIDDIHQQARDAAGNPVTARLIDDSGRRLTDTSYSRAASHAATERKTWEAKTANDSALDAGNRASFLATSSQTPSLADDAGVQQQLMRSDMEITNLAHGQGYDDPAIAAEVAKNRGRNVANIVKQIAGDPATGDITPGGVKRAFDFYKTQEEKVDAGSRVAIQNFLKGPLNQIAGQRIGDEVLGRPPARLPPEIVADVPASFVGAIRQTEGFAAKAKWDFKQYTNGFGTRALSPDEVIDLPTATARYNAALTKAARFVDSVNPNLDPGTRSALASLTFNAGEGWADAGLGSKVRAGDVAGAKELFLQYNKAGGETNEGLVTRRAREASWFGRGDISPTEAQAPLINKGTAMLKIMDDPALQARPQVQAAALAHLNKVYQAWELQGATDSAAFKLKLQDSTAEALDTGQVKAPLGLDQFITGMGADKGPEAFEEYKKNVQLGADIRSTAALAPGETAALRTKYTPQPGEGYVAQQERSQALDKAIAHNEKAKAKDPADFLIRSTDFGRDAYQQFQTLMADKNATPQMRTAYAGMFADKMLAEQTRLGIPADQQRVVPAWYTDQLNARIETPATGGGSLAVSQAIESEAKLWGRQWPNVYRQLSEKASPVVRVIGSGVQPAAAQLLSDLGPLTVSSILKDQDTEKNATIKKDVLNAFKPLATSMVGIEGATSIFNDFRGQAEKLAAYYVIGGATSSDAATKAYEQLVGFKYTFQNTYRVPKDSGVDPDTIAKGSVVALRDLKDVLPGADNMGGLPADYRTEATLRSLQRDGKWVTSNDEGGLMLIHNGQPVLRGDGKQPVVVRWRELADMAAKEDRRVVRDVIPHEAVSLQNLN